MCFAVHGSKGRLITPRSRSWGGVTGAIVAIGLLGCSGARSKDSPPPQGSRAETPIHSRPELSQEEAPAGTFLWGRLKEPGNLADSLVAAAGLPMRWRVLLNGASKFAALADAEASVEVAVALRPGGQRGALGVVSWGVSSERAVLDVLERHQVSTERGADDVYLFTLDEAACVLGPALGPAPVRVVCGEKPESVELLGTYALRGLPLHSFSDANAHLELRLSPLKDAYGQQLGSLKLLSSVLIRQLQIDQPRFDRGIADAVFGLADEVIALSEELEDAHLKLWSRDSSYDLSLSGTARGSKSWAVTALREMAARQSPPPDTFWSLPANASAGFFRKPAASAQVRPFGDVLRDMLVGYLEGEGLSTGTRDRVDRWLETLLELDGGTVSAVGPRVPSESGEGSTPSWMLWGIEGQATPYRKQLEELTTILAAPDLRRLAGRGAPWPFELKRQGALPKYPGSSVFEWTSTGLSGSLLRGLSAMKGSWATLGDAGGPGVEKRQGYLAIVPTGERAWLVTAERREALTEPLEAMAREGSELRKGAGLDSLRTSQAILGGFFTLESLLGPLEVASEGKYSFQNWERVSRALPHKGRAPVVVQLRSGGGDPLEVELVHTIPREFVADAVALLAKPTENPK